MRLGNAALSRAPLGTSSLKRDRAKGAQARKEGPRQETRGEGAGHGAGQGEASARRVAVPAPAPSTARRPVSHTCSRARRARGRRQVVEHEQMQRSSRCSGVRGEERRRRHASAKRPSPGSPVRRAAGGSSLGSDAHEPQRRLSGQALGIGPPSPRREARTGEEETWRCARRPGGRGEPRRGGKKEGRGARRQGNAQVTSSKPRLPARVPLQCGLEADPARLRGCEEAAADPK